MGPKSKFQLTIAGNTIYVTHEVVRIDKIRLNPDNPRIRFQIKRRYNGRKLSPSELLDLIREQPGYDGLQKAIRKAGGLHDPVVVEADGTIVEGNSRATVYKTLHDGNKRDPRWQRIPIARLPKNVPPKLTAMLMAGYHIAGKTVWRPSAQADQIYELQHVHGWTPEQIADATRMTPKEVEQHLEAYDYLVKEVLPHAGKANGNDILESKFHHALEFVKRKKLAPLRKNPKVRKDFAKLLVQDKIKGVEVRELDKVLTNPRASVALKRSGFQVAREVLREADPVSAVKPLKKMKAFATFLGKLGHKDLDLFKNAKARRVVVELYDAVCNLAACAGVKLRSHNA